jgi:hypothetical protein
MVIGMLPHRPAAGLNAPGQEEHIIDVGRCGEADYRHVIAVCGEVVLGSLLAAIDRVRAGEIAAPWGWLLCGNRIWE